VLVEAARGTAGSRRAPLDAGMPPNWMASSDVDEAWAARGLLEEGVDVIPYRATAASQDSRGRVLVHR